MALKEYKPGTTFPGVVGRTADVSTPAWPEPNRAKEGAPNVLFIVLDDTGFGHLGCYGSPIKTPNLDALAADGLRYNNMHTTALCSPTRSCILTGRNHHSNHMAGITEISTGYPGYDGYIPFENGFLSEILLQHGYNTYAIGKWHLTPSEAISAAGPFDRWPLGRGFERYFGFLSGDTHQYYPELTRDNTSTEPEKTPEEGYHLTPDLVEKAKAMIADAKQVAPDKPFFMYFCTGAMHAPHHVPKEWADKYKGQFDHGYDKQREITFAKQKALGVVPADAELTAHNPEIPYWDDMPEELKPVLARQMEVYAGFLEHTDAQVGKLVDALEELEILDDTLFIYIIGDNGASAEGTPQGTFNEMIPLNGFNELETPEFMASHMDDFGGPDSYNHYAVGWAHAMCAPFQWTKQIASHWGGTRNGTVVHWPKGIRAKGEVRSQFHHVIDIAPTILEAAGLPEPTFVHGVQQKPLEGASFAYTFDDPDAEDRHTTQYFEMFGNRGIYHNGWTAVTKHRTPWLLGAIELPAFDDDNWELYNTTEDWTQANDLSAEYPEKLHELQRLWLIEAVKYNVLPIDDRTAERFNSELAGRPDLMAGRSSMRLDGHTRRLQENAAPNTKNKSFAVTAELVVPEGGAEGVIATQGGAFGGWGLYAKEGKLKYCYNFIGLDRAYVEAEQPLEPGERQVRIEFRYDGGGAGKGADLVLFIEGEEVGQGRTERSIPYLISLDETLDVGTDAGTPVTDDYPARGNEFNGKIKWVQIDLEPDDHSHMIDTDHMAHVRLVKQ